MALSKLSIWGLNQIPWLINYRDPTFAPRAALGDSGEKKTWWTGRLPPPEHPKSVQVTSMLEAEPPRLTSTQRRGSGRIIWLNFVTLHSCLVEVIYRSVKSDPSCQRHSHFTLRLQSLLFGAINHSEKKVQLQTSSLVKPLWKWRSVCLRLASDGAWQEPDSRWLRICIFFSLPLSNQTFVPSGLVSAPLHHEDSKVFVCHLRNWQSRGDTNDPPCSSRAAATWRCVRS